MNPLPENKIRSKHNYVADLEANVVYELAGAPDGITKAKLVPISTTAGTVQTSDDDASGFADVDLDAGAAFTKGDVKTYVRATSDATVTFFVL